MERLEVAGTLVSASRIVGAMTGEVSLVLGSTDEMTLDNRAILGVPRGGNLVVGLASLF